MCAGEVSRLTLQRVWVRWGSMYAYVGEVRAPSLREYQYVEEACRCVLGKQVCLGFKRTPTLVRYAQASGLFLLSGRGNMFGEG